MPPSRGTSSGHRPSAPRGKVALPSTHTTISGYLLTNPSLTPISTTSKASRQQAPHGAQSSAGVNAGQAAHPRSSRAPPNRRHRGTAGPRPPS